MHLGIDFWKDLEGFWKPKWNHVGTHIDQKSMALAENEFLKNRALPAAGAWFLGSGGPSWEQKSMENRLKKEVNMGRHLDIDFQWILVDLWRQAGKENGGMLASKIEQKSMLSSRGGFLKKPWFWRSRGSKLGAKIDQKSIKKGGQHAKASSHRFFIDLGGFWEPSWKAKSSPDRLKITSTKRWGFLRHPGRCNF